MPPPQEGLQTGWVRRKNLSRQARYDFIAQVYCCFDILDPFAAGGMGFSFELGLSAEEIEEPGSQLGGDVLELSAEQFISSCRTQSFLMAVHF